MDDHQRLSPKSGSPSPKNLCTRYTGAFFPDSQHLVVAGGIFTSNNVVESVPPDFLRIPLGSIDLRREIRLDEAMVVVSRNSKRCSIRRVYSARVGSCDKPMTAILYHVAWQDWNNCVSCHLSVRHSHILQIYGTASSSGIHAAVFHGDLIPFKQFLASFRHSSIMQVYIIAYASLQTSAAEEYAAALIPTSALGRIFWIRRSTGRLSLEFIGDQTYAEFAFGAEELSPPESLMALQHPHQEAQVIASLGFHRWYSLCALYQTQRRSSSISVQAEVKLGSIIYWRPGRPFQDTTEIAKSVVPQITRYGWDVLNGTKLFRDGFSRCNAADVFSSEISLTRYHDTPHISWLAQANSIFRQLQIVANYGDYIFIDWVNFILKIGAPNPNTPHGYLFLCPPVHFDIGATSSRWPARPAYWSLDPSGNDPLSAEEAASLGYPSITLRTEASMAFWDENVYAGLRKFNEGKGLDPEGQDVLRDLGFPLFEGDRSDHPTADIELTAYCGG
ncbi:hypothetical protein MSAN_01799800 [Mycena sanguinolenta]|uniref:Uncharacterized protein n=1 Tax=Mycena sanguinolenta TaxID=230812 RepID=A0A8H6XRD9_9AGAR|nr:hypothetical protein MSAN_01799800 [Mycena sanguinolenta]